MTQPVGLVDGTFAGTDLHAVYALQLSEIGAPHLPALAELPEVGPHATGLGKVIANLNLPFELRSYGWQLQRGDRISAIDQLRATSHRDSTIQALADVAEHTPVPELSVRLLGPIALMTSGWLPSGQRILRDPGARADIAGAWAEAAATLVRRIRTVLGAEPTVLVQEHTAQQAVDGQVRTASGAGFERSVDIAEVRDTWQLISQQDATVLIEAPADLVTTAAEVTGLVLDWPQGRNRAIEQTWERVDRLVQAETPVALHLEHRANPERYAEELIQQYLDWGLPFDGLGQLRLVQRFHAEPESQAGAKLQWLRAVADHAGEYAASL